jgi:hypothetical protein
MMSVKLINLQLIYLAIKSCVIGQGEIELSPEMKSSWTTRKTSITAVKTERFKFKKN